MKKPQTILTLALPIFRMHGKISKKSKLVYRIRCGRQQTYILNHATPKSSAQRANQAVFGMVSAIVNRLFKDPSQEIYWQQIAATQNFKTARKAAYAHYKAIVISQIEAEQQAKLQTVPTSKRQQKQTPQRHINTPNLESPNINLATFNTLLLVARYLCQHAKIDKHSALPNHHT